MFKFLTKSTFLFLCASSLFFGACKKDSDPKIDPSLIVGKWEITHSISWDLKNGKIVEDTKENFIPSADEKWSFEFTVDSKFINSGLENIGIYNLSADSKLLTTVTPNAHSDKPIEETYTIESITSEELVLSLSISETNPQTHETESWRTEDHYKRIN